MKKCPNCSRETLRTKDWACQWCGYPLLSTSYEAIEKTYSQSQAERFNAPAGIELTLEPETRYVASPEVKSGAININLRCLLYLVALAGAGFTTFYLNSVGGIIFFFGILISLIINSSLARDEALRGLWLSLGLVPLIRLANLVTPQMELPAPYWQILIAIPVMIAVMLIKQSLKLKLYDIGLNSNKLLIQALIAVTGIGLGIIGHFILQPEELTSELTIEATLFPAIVLLITTGFVEELAFRGVLQQATGVLGSWGWVYPAIIYALLQIGQGTAQYCLFTLTIALYFGWIVKKTGSVWGVSLSHGLLNIGLFLIFPHIF